jgi:hypothetical protein
LQQRPQRLDLRGTERRCRVDERSDVLLERTSGSRGCLWEPIGSSLRLSVHALRRCAGAGRGDGPHPCPNPCPAASHPCPRLLATPPGRVAVGDRAGRAAAGSVTDCIPCSRMVVRVVSRPRRTQHGRSRPAHGGRGAGGRRDSTGQRRGRPDCTLGRSSQWMRDSRNDARGCVAPLGCLTSKSRPSARCRSRSEAGTSSAASGRPGLTGPDPEPWTR